jgi:NitT/TauT family transport system ATP-binding protein
MPGGERLRVAIAGRGYGGRAVLGPIGFEAGPGEVLALLAPSGTGKTTALRIVLGLDLDFTGNVTRPAGAVGAMFQEPRLLPWLDVAGNLRLVAPGLDEAGLAALLATVGLGGSSSLLPRALSLGMARRVALARALAVRPRLLVLDEPFASLDPQLGGKLAAATAAAARGMGAVTVMATHDLDQALAVADRILVLAGAPACLAADMACPAEGERAGFGATVRERFGFLEGRERPVPTGASSRNSRPPA